MATDYPKLRDDLVIKRQVMGGEVTHLIKVRETQEYLRFREMEWAIVSRLDGQTGFAALAERFNEQFPDTPLDAGQVEDFVESLKKKEVIVRTPAERGIVILEKLQAERKKRAERSQAKDAFYLTLATTNPDRFYRAIYPYLRWIWTRQFVIATLLLFLAAASVVVTNWPVVRQGMLNFWSFQGKTTADVVMLFFILAVIVAIHESAHALTCMNFGGEVTELGFMLIFFMPAFYANVSDAYLFDKKWHKYWVTLAGGYSELIICSFAVFTWSLAEPDTLLYHVAYNTMVFAGISTIIFNYNPLIKLDGYYLLSDILEVSNLRENAAAYLVYLIKNRVFRVAAEPPLHLTPRKKRIFLIYGILSTCYIILIVSLFILFVFNYFLRTFPQMGVFLGFFAAYLILKKRIKKFMAFSRFVLLDKRDLFKQKAAVRRWAYAAGGLLLLFLFFPFSHSVTARLTLEPARRQALRAEVEGFVAEALGDTDAAVSVGTLILRLRNPELFARSQKAQAEVERLTAEATRALAADDVAAYQAAVRSQQQAQTQLADLRLQLSRLEIRAPFTGHLLTPRLHDFIGRHVVPGDLLCEFGALDPMRALMRVSEFNFPELAEGQPVRVKLNSFPGQTFTGQVARRSMASPDAYDAAGRTTDLVRSVLAANVGKEGTVFSSFDVAVEIPNPAARLRPGMTGTAKITPDRHSLAFRIYRSVRDLVRSRIWW